jgi:hypothetical protein
MAGLAFVEPYQVYPEQEFEAALSAVLEQVLTSLSVPFVLLPHRRLDIAAFFERDGRTHSVLLEVKAFGGQRQGGVGFGDSRGEGRQVDMLLCEDRLLGLFAQPVRWAFADATMDVGSARYGLFTCEEMKASVMAGVGRGKQNNFSVARLRSGLRSWPLFVSALESWVATA